MPAPIVLYAVRKTAQQELVITELFNSRDQLFGEHYSAVTALRLAGASCVIVYNREDGKAALYKASSTAPHLERAGEFQLERNLSAIEPFVIGNQPHLLCYEATAGNFYFHSVASNLAVSSAYNFRRTHEPGPTSGFATVKLFTAGPGGGVVLLGYNFNTGAVAMYTLSVTATSPDGFPPLFALPVWSHQWAKGWTRFAFFQLGHSNFFLKTNTAKENVNIDHVVDDLAAGTVEVATAMQNQLPDNQSLKLVEPLYFGHGDPYFVTYKEDGTTRLYRIWTDCQGWDSAGSVTAPGGANFLVTLRDDQDNLLLLC